MRAVIPETELENCEGCQTAGRYCLYDCRACLGRWLARECRLFPATLPAWRRLATERLGREIVDAFLFEQGIISR